MIDYRSYTSLSSSLFIKWVIPNFETALISDYHSNYTIAGDVYTNIGRLLAVTSPVSELKTSPSEITISLSGIPTNSVSDILSKQIKGSSIQVTRVFFDAVTNAEINALLKFKGIVTNYDISDDVDVAAQIATTTITLTCASIVEVLSKKISGRRTNPMDFADESSMSRVQALANSNFNFGAPK